MIQRKNEEDEMFAEVLFLEIQENLNNFMAEHSGIVIKETTRAEWGKQPAAGKKPSRE